MLRESSCPFDKEIVFLASSGLQIEVSSLTPSHIPNWSAVLVGPAPMNSTLSGTSSSLAVFYVLFSLSDLL